MSSSSAVPSAPETPAPGAAPPPRTHSAPSATPLSSPSDPRVNEDATLHLLHEFQQLQSAEERYKYVEETLRAACVFLSQGGQRVPVPEVVGSGGVIGPLHGDLRSLGFLMGHVFKMGQLRGVGLRDFLGLVMHIVSIVPAKKLVLDVCVDPQNGPPVSGMKDVFVRE